MPICQRIHEQAKSTHDGYFLQKIEKAATFQQHHPHEFHHVSYRVEPGDNLGPGWHAFNSGELAAH